jgi:glycosyltransferase involved in cell wall biosynthesis
LTAGEHFGIVPIEAMYCQLPVVAVNDGGPTETVVDGLTGFLCDPDPESFAEVKRAPLFGLQLGPMLKNFLRL